MKTSVLALAVILIAVINISAQSVIPIDQNTYNSLVTGSAWQAIGDTYGDLDLRTATAYVGVGTANYAAGTPVPIVLSQSGGTLGFYDNGPTLKSYIPTAYVTAPSTAPISGFALNLTAAEQQAGYEALINGITVSLDGGAPVNIPLTLDTSKSLFQALEINFGRSVSTYSVGFNLNLPCGINYISGFEGLGLTDCQVPEPTVFAVAGLGMVALLLVRRRKSQ